MLSICIPTINRSIFLLQGLRSIFNDSILSEKIEICISNNCSDENYDEVEKFIINQPSIKYIRQPHRISLDENMHACVKMACGEYVFYLGDDDYFLERGIDDLITLVDNEKPDLLVLNALIVTEFSAPIGRLFPCDDLIFKEVKSAYHFYNDKTAYGAVLVKRAYLDDSIFKNFYGTSHAYMCFWVSLVIHSYCHPNVHVKVITPKKPIVALRQAKKTYSDYALDVHYKHMPMWYCLFKSYIMDAEMMKIATKVERDNFTKGQGLRFLISLKLQGIDFKYFKNTLNFDSGKIFTLLRFKILLIKILPISSLKMIRTFKNLLLKFCFSH